MALVLRDRVKETTTTTGTATYTLAGAVAGFETFGSVGDGNTTYYACSDGTDFEVGIGTYTASGTTLARTTILQSSNSDAAVNWSSGTRTIFCTLPAEKMSFLDGSGDLTLTGANYNIVFDKSDDALEFADNAKAVFGTGGDLEIYHQSSSGNTFIQESGSGGLFIDASNLSLRNSAGENLGRFLSNGAVELYHDNSKKLETASGGVTITGAATATSFSGDGSSLTALNASQLSSGTVPNARLDAQLQDVAGLATTDGGFIVGDGSNFVLESGATARTSLGLGSAATSNTTDFDAAGEAVALAIALG
jgi:hypothetical protein